jgi:O-antigen biosynthesis protein
LKISIIIVNYNVRYFLEQCLLSVEKAIRHLDAEVFVVDNNSVDGSVEMVRTRFTWVKVIANKENTGFSKANNQAMQVANGQYFLLLNPDTLVEEDTFQKVIQFMDEHPEAGGLGVKMVDGKGNFLPESKRGLTTPEVAFYKIFGISKLFPRSARFNKYYLGNLSNDEVNEIDILSGAFMLMRKKALDKVGLLDEAFFMYGEDIDLSWRIIQAGWKNYYYPLTRIIHYKGESTKKGSLNYVFVFYNAMVIFAKKHFSEKNAKLFSFFINMAIWLRAAIAVVSRFFKAIFLPLLDVVTILAGLFLVKNQYAIYQNKIYDDQLVTYAFGSYVFIWCVNTWFAGGYDKPIKPLKIIRPVLVGSALILIAYSLLPESMRFSRAMIVFGTGVALVSMFLIRVAYNIILKGRSGLEKTSGRRFALVGSGEEINRVKTILVQTNYEVGFMVQVSPSLTINPGDVGHMHQLDEIVRVHNIDQVVFCARDVSSTDIISTMSAIEEKNVEFKIAPPESLYIIGSNSIETTGDVFMLDVNSVSLTRNQRAKRLFDVAVSLLFLPLLPILVFLVKKPAGLFANIFSVFTGKKSWVGYSPDIHSSQEMKLASAKLPKLKSGVLNPLSIYPASARTAENIQKLNVVYAKDYRFSNDLSIVWNGRRDLGN